MPTYTDEVNIYNPNAIQQGIDEAGTTASAYITEVSADNGIVVAPVGKGTVNKAITSATTGWHLADVLEYIRNGVSRFWIGLKNAGDTTPTVRIGKKFVNGASDNESHMELDYRSMKLINEDGDTFFHAGDARGEKQYVDIPDDGYRDDRSSGKAAYALNGVLRYEDTLTAASGGNEGFPLYPPVDTSLFSYSGITAKLNGNVLSSGDYTVSPRIVTIDGVDYAVDMVRVTGVSVGDVLSFNWPTAAVDFPMYMTFGSRAGFIGYGSSVLGEECTASGFFSHAEGAKLGYDEAGWDDHGTIASGRGSHAEGIAAVSSGVGSHAEGSVAKWRPSGSISSAFKPVTASGEGSHAEGAGAEASGYASHAQNEGTIAAYDSQTAIGAWNDNQSANVFEIGNGTDDDNRSNALAVDWNGNALIAGEVQDMSGNAKYTKTRVKGNAETTYRTGDVNLTPANIGAAAASHGNHVPAVQTANNAVYLRNDNTWHTITPANIGAAASSHSHSQSSMVITRSFTNSAASGSIAAGANWSAVFSGTNVSGYTKVGLVSLTGAGSNFAIRTMDIDQDSAEIHLFNKGSSAASCAKGAATATFAYVRSSVSVS